MRTFACLSDMNDVILYLAILAAIGWVLYSILSSHPSLEGIPVFNPPQRNSLGIKVQADKQLFLTNAKELIRDGCDRVRVRNMQLDPLG